MSFTDTDTFQELLAICSDGATAAHRGEATRLLASELVARLAITDRNHNPVPPSAGYNFHPAWDHLTAENGSPKIAAFYRTRGALPRHRWIGTVPQEPRPQAEYDLTLVAVEIAAATLAAAAEPLMPPGLFLASVDGDVARARVLYTATPGARHSILQADVPSGWSIGGFDLVVPANGDYWLEFKGAVHSTDPTVHADIPVRIAVNGLEADVFTSNRDNKIWLEQDSLTTAEDLALFPRPARAGAAQEDPPRTLLSLTGGDAVDVRNGSATFDHTIQGQIRIWPAP